MYVDAHTHTNAHMYVYADVYYFLYKAVWLTSRMCKKRTKIRSETIKCNLTR